MLGRGEPSVMCCHLLPLHHCEQGLVPCRTGPLSSCCKGTGLNSRDAFTSTDQGVFQMEQLSVQTAWLPVCLHALAEEETERCSQLWGHHQAANDTQQHPAGKPSSGIK